MASVIYDSVDVLPGPVQIVSILLYTVEYLSLRGCSHKIDVTRKTFFHPAEVQASRKSKSLSN